MTKTGLFITLCLSLLISSFNIARAEDETIMKELQGFDQYVEESMKLWNIPGVAIAIVKDDKVIYEKGFGYRDVGNSLQVTPQTLFGIGSTTKAFTATALGMLVDQEIIDWDQPIRNYFASLRLYDDYVTNNVSIRDLLTHRTGLPGHDGLWYQTPFKREELIEKLRYLEPSAPFRTKFQYNNLMYTLAGFTLEQIAHKRWEDSVRENIFIPLEMNNSNFSIEELKKSNNYALTYKENEGKLEKTDFINIVNVGPAGSINSSVDQMANWLIFNINNGRFKETQLITEDTLNQIHTPQIITPEAREFNEFSLKSYALGWGSFFYRGHFLVIHGGEIGGFKSLVSFMPDEKIGIVILTNKNSAITDIISCNTYDRLLGLEQLPWNERFQEQIDLIKEQKKQYLESLNTEKVKPSKPSHPFEDYCGNYLHPAYGVITVSISENKLKGEMHKEPFNIDHKTFDTFEGYSPEEPETTKFRMTFYMDQEGIINKLGIPLVPELGKDILFVKECF